MKLREANWQLEQYEESAAPKGWVCSWDRYGKIFLEDLWPLVHMDLRTVWVQICHILAEDGELITFFRRESDQFLTLEWSKFQNPRRNQKMENECQIEVHGSRKSLCDCIGYVYRVY